MQLTITVIHMDRSYHILKPNKGGERNTVAPLHLSKKNKNSIYKTEGQLIKQINCKMNVVSQGVLFGGVKYNIDEKRSL